MIDATGVRLVISICSLELCRAEDSREAVVVLVAIVILLLVLIVLLVLILVLELI